ncbi:hypothetical protein M0804_007796 [Polistes exclamans]|nr:hypothetical protein M0804_007796 [Polistes exclamans]
MGIENQRVDEIPSDVGRVVVVVVVGVKVGRGGPFGDIGNPKVVNLGKLVDVDGSPLTFPLFLIKKKKASKIPTKPTEVLPKHVFRIALFR